MDFYHTVVDLPDVGYTSTRSEEFWTTRNHSTAGISFTKASHYYTYEENRLFTSYSIFQIREINAGLGNGSSASYSNAFFDDLADCVNKNPCIIPPIAGPYLTPNSATCCHPPPASALFWNPRPKTPATFWNFNDVTVDATSFSKDHNGSTYMTTHQEGPINYIKSTKVISVCGKIFPIFNPMGPIPGPLVIGTTCASTPFVAVVSIQGWSLVTPINAGGVTTMEATDKYPNTGQIQLSTLTNSSISRTFRSFTFSGVNITVTVPTTAMSGTDIIGSTTTGSEAFTTFGTTSGYTTIYNPAGGIFTTGKYFPESVDVHGNSLKSVRVVTFCNDGMTGNNLSAFNNEQGYSFTTSGDVAADGSYALLTKLARATDSLSYEDQIRNVTVQSFVQGKSWTTKNVILKQVNLNLHCLTTGALVTITNLSAYNKVPFPATSSDNTVEVNPHTTRMTTIKNTVFDSFNEGQVELGFGLVYPVEPVETTYERMETVDKFVYFPKAQANFYARESASNVSMATDTYTQQITDYQGSVALLTRFEDETITPNTNGSTTNKYTLNQGYTAKETAIKFFGLGVHAGANLNGFTVATPMMEQGFRAASVARYTDKAFSDLEFNIQKITDTIWQVNDLGGGATTSIQAQVVTDPFKSGILFPFISKEQHSSISVFMNYPSTTSIKDANVSYGTNPFIHTLEFSFSGDHFTFTRRNYPVFKSGNGVLYTSADLSVSSKTYTGSIKFLAELTPRTVSRGQIPDRLVFGGNLAIATEKEVFGQFGLDGLNFFAETISKDGIPAITETTKMMRHLASIGFTVPPNITLAIPSTTKIGGHYSIEGIPGVATAIGGMELFSIKIGEGSRITSTAKYNYEDD